MPVMQVRQVRMAVRERFVRVRVRMRLGPLVAAVRMLMVRVVGVHVYVHELFMFMRVPVAFREHQPGGHDHQQECAHETGRHWLAQ